MHNSGGMFPDKIYRADACCCWVVGIHGVVEEEIALSGCGKVSQSATFGM